jgi:beta-fructofuranosidase
MPPALRSSARLALRRALLPALLALGLVPLAAAAATTPGFTPLAGQALSSSMIPPAPGRAKEFAFIRANGLFHLFYMSDNLTVLQDSTEREFGHAVSTDLVHWTQLGAVLHVRPDKWDNFHVWAPDIVEQDGVFYMYYVGVTYEPFSWTWYQHIGVATSTDLMNWTRYDAPVYDGNRVSWAYCDSSQFDGAQFRDADVIPDPDHPGQQLMYYVTEPATAHGQLLVGVARNSGGLTPWHDVGPMWSTDAAHFWGWVESPQVFQHDGLWYLFVTTNSGHVINFRTSPVLTTDSTYWNVKYRLYDYVGHDAMSDLWFGVEHLLFDGHDYLAYVNPYDNGIDIQEMIWGTPPDFFSLAPAQTASVPPAAPPTRLALAVLGSGANAGEVVLRCSLPRAGPARLELYDVTGRRVRRLRDGPQPQGESLVTWDGRDESGARVARGIYFARLLTPSGQAAARVLVTD